MLIPLSTLKKSLDNKLGINSWKEYETETLLLELGLPFSDLLYDKLSILKVIEHRPDLLFQDVLFLIVATAGMNNEEVDFYYLPHLLSLELAFSIVEITKILGVELHTLPEFAPGPTQYIRDVLINEGYSEILYPFDVVGLGSLPKGQTIRDTIDKGVAIKEYISAMYNQ